MNELHEAFNTRFEELKQEDGGAELCALEWSLSVSFSVIVCACVRACVRACLCMRE